MVQPDIKQQLHDLQTQAANLLALAEAIPVSENSEDCDFQFYSMFLEKQAKAVGWLAMALNPPETED